MDFNISQLIITPSRNEVIKKLHNTIENEFKGILFISGPSKCGKLITLTHLLKKNSCTFYSTDCNGHNKQSLLRSLISSINTEEENDPEEDGNLSIDPLISETKKLRKIPNEQITIIDIIKELYERKLKNSNKILYIIFRNSEQLLKRDKEFFYSLFKVRDYLKYPVCIFLLTKTVKERMISTSHEYGITRSIYFEDYEKSELEMIVSKYHPNFSINQDLSNEIQLELYHKLVELVVETFYSTTRNFYDILNSCLVLFQEYIRPTRIDLPYIGIDQSSVDSFNYYYTINGIQTEKSIYLCQKIKEEFKSNNNSKFRIIKVPINLSKNKENKDIQQDIKEEINQNNNNNNNNNDDEIKPYKVVFELDDEKYIEEYWNKNFIMFFTKNSQDNNNNTTTTTKIKKDKFVFDKAKLYQNIKPMLLDRLRNLIEKVKDENKLQGSSNSTSTSTSAASSILDNIHLKSIENFSYETKSLLISCYLASTISITKDKLLYSKETIKRQSKSQERSRGIASNWFTYERAKNISKKLFKTNDINDNIFATLVNLHYLEVSHTLESTIPVKYKCTSKTHLDFIKQVSKSISFDIEAHIEVALFSK